MESSTLNIRAIKVGLLDFYSGFEPKHLFFLKAALDAGRIILAPILDCDILLSSVFGTAAAASQLHHKPVVVVSGESFQAPQADWSILTTNHQIKTTQHYYAPRGMMWYDVSKDLKKYAHVKKTKFCCFCVSAANPDLPGGMHRDAFFKQLSLKKHVDSVGKHLNNMPDNWTAPSEGFEEFVAQYKFMICFENNAVPGYVTEKAMRCFVAGTVPIYWAHASCTEIFSVSAMVLCDPTRMDEAVQRVLELDNDDAEYERMRSAPALLSQDLFDRDRLQRVFDAKIVELGESRFSVLGGEKGGGLGGRVHQVVCINLSTRPDRLNQFIATELSGFQAVSKNTVMRFSAWATEFGGKGCARSHLAVLREAQAKQWPNVLIVEDDFTFTRPWPDVCASVNAFIESAADNWDVLMLTADLVVPEGFKYSCARVQNAQTASCYIVNSRAYVHLDAIFSDSYAHLPLSKSSLGWRDVYAKYAIDQNWKVLQPHLQWFLLTPKAGIQRPSYSDIENSYVDYKL